MPKQIELSKLSPAPRRVPAAIGWRLMPFGLPFGVAMGVMGWFLWRLGLALATVEGEASSILRWLWAGIASAAAVILVFSLRTWLRRIRVLRKGEVAAAEILAVHASPSAYKPRDAWRYVEWKHTPSKPSDVKRQLKDLRARWEDSHRSWNGFGSCLFRFRLPDGSVVVTGCQAAVEERVVQERFDVNDVALYDPAHPENALLLSLAWPPLAVTSSGEWRLASRASASLGCLLAWIGLLAGVCAWFWLLFR